jgi:hypothetical protein
MWRRRVSRRAKMLNSASRTSHDISAKWRPSPSCPMSRRTASRCSIRSIRSTATADCSASAFRPYALGIAYEFDPYFGLSISPVDPLPHQLDAIYDYLLKLARVRFLLADGAFVFKMRDPNLRPLSTRQQADSRGAARPHTFRGAGSGRDHKSTGRSRGGRWSWLTRALPAPTSGLRP